MGHARWAGASARDWSGNPVTYVQVRKGNVDCGRCLRRARDGPRTDERSVRRLNRYTMAGIDELRVLADGPRWRR